MPTSPSALARALTTAWDRIRSDVVDLPPVRPALTTAPPPADHSHDRWRWEGDCVDGLVLSADTLRQGPDAIVTFLLHEAAHILCWIRGIKDTAQRGVYHNQRYLVAAEEVGLIWPADRPRRPRRGYPDPVMSPEAARRHAEDCRELEDLLPDVLPHLDPSSETPRTARPETRATVQCRCDRPRRIRVAKTVLAQGPIICGVCGAPFK